MPNADHSRASRILQVIWVGFFALSVLYGAIALASVNTAMGDITFSLPNVRSGSELVVTILAVINLVQVGMLSRSMVHSLRRRMRSDLSKMPLLPFLTPWIVRWAVLTAVPLWGAFLVFECHDFGKFLPFLGVTLVGLIGTYPSSAKVKRLVARAQDTGAGADGGCQKLV